MNPTLALVLLGGLVSTPTDTLLDVRQGDQLLLRDLRGSVVIDVWDRPQLEAEVYLVEGAAMTFERRGSKIQSASSGRRSRRDVEMRLRIPSWLPVEITGGDLDIWARGLESDLSVHTLSGEIGLEDLAGSVHLYSTDGEVDASGLTGMAHLRTGDGEVVIRDSRADLEVETVDGEVRLMGLEAAKVLVRSTDGEIDFQGNILEGGTYAFSTHSADITLRLTPPLNLDARILAYGGEFGSDFPVRAQAIRSGEGMEFTMGAGGASLTIETFNGDVRFHDDRAPMTPKTRTSFPKKKQRGVER